MKKALWCEVKRNLLPLVIFAAIALIVGVSYTSTMELRVGAFASFRYDSGLACYAVLLCVLCTVIPVLQFSYRMKQRSVDLWYSLPITRKQLVLVRTLAGLLLVFVPFTIAYWPGVAIVAMRCNELASSVRGFHFQYIHYLSCFAQMLLLGTCLFGVNAFLFTRGNSMFDGIFFILGWAILVPLFVVVLNDDFAFDFYWQGASGRQTWVNSSLFFTYFFTYSPVAWTGAAFEKLITVGAFFDNEFHLMVTSILGVLEGAAAYLALFLLADKDKSENVGQISSSRMGYKVLLPALEAGVIALIIVSVGWGWFDWNTVFYLVLVALCALAFYFAYRRSFRLKLSDILSVILALVAGVLLVLLLSGISWIPDEIAYLTLF